MKMRSVLATVSLVSLLAMAVLLGGCGSIGRSPDPNFYLLSSPEVNQVRGEVTGPRVSVGPVILPGYLDRMEILVRSENGVNTRPEKFELWSEQLDDGIERVLCAAISRRLQPRNGHAFPMRAPLHPQWRISMEVSRMDGAPGETVVLECAWALTDKAGNLIESGRFAGSRSAGDSVASMVEAYSELLVQLGDELGAVIP